jgi:hypothetical protein
VARIGWFAYDTTTYYDGEGDTEKFLGNTYYYF